MDAAGMTDVDGLRDSDVWWGVLGVMDDARGGVTWGDGMWVGDVDDKWWLDVMGVRGSEAVIDGIRRDVMVHGVLKDGVWW